MLGFDLLSLNSTLLEMVINKLDEKSYFRLQQTSKVLNKFIRNSKNICVHLSKSYNFFDVFFKDEDRERDRYEMDVECLYGVRFSLIRLGIESFSSENSEIYKKNCDYLKKYRITCTRLDLSCLGDDDDDDASIEKMKMLMDIVKPTIASIDGTFYDDEREDLLRAVPYRCKALLQSETLKEIHVSLDLGDIATLVPQLFSKFSSVRVSCQIYSAEEQIEVLRTMLKILRSQPFPNLQNFSFLSYLQSKHANLLAIKFDEVKEEFKYLNWRYARECEDNGCKDQMEDKLDDLVSSCEEEDHDKDETKDEVNEGIEKEMSGKKEEIKDMDKSETAEHKQVEKEDKDEEEEEINGDNGDYEDEDRIKHIEKRMNALLDFLLNYSERDLITVLKNSNDSEEDQGPRIVEKLSATLELPNGSCKFVGEKSTGVSILSMKFGDPDRF